MEKAPEETPQFLLLVREWLRPGCDKAYHENELRLAATCATLNCPHPYLALASVTPPKQVWWLNAFASAEERDGLDDAYARNKPLMAALAPLGRRKEEFREALVTTRTTYRPDLSGGASLKIIGARFFVISTAKDQRGPDGTVFESSDGERFTIATALNRAVAEEIVTQFGSKAMVLAVQPQWSFPDETWVRADPDFWSSSPDRSNGYEGIAAEFLAGRGRAPSTAIGTTAAHNWARTLPAGATVIDLGCGSGLPITKVLVGEGLNVYAIDASPSMVRAFRQNFPQIPVACESVADSPFFDRKFDGVLSWGLMFLLPPEEQRRIIQRCANILIPGGRLLFTSPPEPEVWNDAMTGLESRSLGAVEYRRLLSTAGLSVLREYEDEGQNHYYDAIKNGKLGGA